MRHRNATPALALPLTLAAFGLAPALAAGGSGLSLSPSIVEHAAVAGTVGSIKVANSTGQAMRISVSAHPWLQSTSGTSVPNQRASLSGVRTSIGSFTLANGASQIVSLALVGSPARGSLYGNVEVTGIPTQPARGRNAVNLEYRLIGSLRLNPLHAAYRARAGRVVVTGTHRRGTVSLAVRNTGNTIAPIGGSVSIRGPRGGESGAIAAVRILPGATVNLPVLALSGSLPAGSYALSASLTQAGRNILKASKGFRLR